MVRASALYIVSCSVQHWQRGQRIPGLAICMPRITRIIAARAWCCLSAPAQLLQVRMPQALDSHMEWATFVCVRLMASCLDRLPELTHPQDLMHDYLCGWTCLVEEVHPLCSVADTYYH